MTSERARSGPPPVGPAPDTSSAVLTLPNAISAARIALIPVFEVSGAAAASSAAYIVSLVLTAMAYRKLSGGSIGDAVLPRRADVPLYLDGFRSLLGRVVPARGARGEA